MNTVNSPDIHMPARKYKYNHSFIICTIKFNGIDGVKCLCIGFVRIHRDLQRFERICENSFGFLVIKRICENSLGFYENSGEFVIIHLDSCDLHGFPRIYEKF